MTRVCLLAVVAALFAASPGLAFDANKLGQGGSLPLSDLDALIAQSAALKQEVAAALTTARSAPTTLFAQAIASPANGSISAGCGLRPILAILRANGSSSRPPRG